MRIKEVIVEGGWRSTITQNTTITPDVVQRALKIVRRFTKDFNQYLKQQDVPAIQMGHTTGSSAHHVIDSQENPKNTYGDIDLQMITPVTSDIKTHRQYQGVWNKLSDNFISAAKPKYVFQDGKPDNGHIIFAIGNEEYVQVDMLWTQPENAEWARYRTTPERGIKGSIYGNLYSSLGEIMNMSIQLSGVQIKILNNEPVDFQYGRKFDYVTTISKDITNFGVDILTSLYKIIHPGADNMIIDAELQAHPGLDKAKPAISDLVSMIKGLAKSFEINDMYGKFNLKEFTNAQNFVSEFLLQYQRKATKSMTSSKFNKAETPDAQSQAQKTKDDIVHGVQLVRKLFA